MVFESGIDRVDDGETGLSGSLIKLTIAPQLSIGRGFNSRPVLRLYLTWAAWSDDFVGHVGGLDYTNSSDGLTLGMQMETWWLAGGAGRGSQSRSEPFRGIGSQTGIVIAGAARCHPHMMKMAAQTFGITVAEGIEGRSLTRQKVGKVVGPLKTTVFLFEDGETRICLITSHFLTHFYRFSNLYRKRIAEALGLPFAQVLSFSSHNHCAVKMVHDQYGFGRAERDLWLEEKDLTDEGLELLRRSIDEICRLPARLEPVTVKWAVGHERRISHNRKGHRVDGTTYFMREEDRLKLGADFNGDIDDDAPVVGFFGTDGRPRAFLTWFTGHPVTAYDPEHLVVFGEFPQVACDRLSEAFGCVPVGFLQGCAGDVSVKGLYGQKPLEESIADATRYGECLGETFIEAAGRLKDSMSDAIGLLSRVVELPYAGLPPLETLEARITETDVFLERCAAGDPDTRTVWGLNFPERMSPTYRAAAVKPLNAWAKWARGLTAGESKERVPTHAEFEVNVLRLGDVGIAGLSCEPFDAIGRQIKRAAPLPLVLPGGYMHDTSLAYVPDSGNNGDLEYMSAFYRYTTTMLPYAQPAGDRLAEAALAMLTELGSG
ncbi:MAG: carbohydrate porin [Opitutaceae bacterium]